MTVSVAVIDFYDDIQHEFMTKMACPVQLRGAPLSILTHEEKDALNDHDFGLVMITKQAHVLRKFPVNDPGNAWLSAQYFDKTHEKLSFPARFVAAKFIKEACDAYQVPASRMVDAYVARVQPGEIDGNVFTEGSEQGWMLRKLAQRELMSKEASAVETNALLQLPDQHFALVVHTGDGTVIRKYAMPDVEHVKMASDYFDKYAMDLSPEHRHRFASSVKNRAEELSVELPKGSALEKWASHDWNRHFDAHLEQRKSLLPRNDQAQQILNKLASAMADTDPETMAQALGTFDQATGLNRYYDRGLTEPYAATMGKTAGAWSADIDEHQLTEQDLRKAAASPRMKSYLGEKFAEEFAKNPVETFEALPDPDKVLIKQIATGEA